MGYAWIWRHPHGGNLGITIHEVHAIKCPCSHSMRTREGLTFISGPDCFHLLTLFPIDHGQFHGPELHSAAPVETQGEGAAALAP